MIRSAIGAIFFDLDNTLLDHSAGARAALSALCNRYPALFKGLTFDQVHDAFILINERYWQSYAAGTLMQEDLTLGRMRDLIGWATMQTGRAAADISAAALNRLYIAELTQATVAYDGVVPMLEALRTRYQLGVISNGFMEVQRGRLRAAGIDRLFDHSIFSDQIGAHKPDPRIFHAALECSGTSAGETLYIGDNFVYDIRGASLAGLGTVWFNPSSSEQPAGVSEICPDAVVRSISDLATLLGVSLHLSPSI